MSIKAVKYVKENARAGGFAQAVLLFLADCHNSDSGQCNPSREMIREFFSSEGEQCSMHRIERALKELRDKGFIRSVKRPCQSGVLNWYEIVGLEAEGNAQNVGNPQNGGNAQNVGNPQNGGNAQNVGGVAHKMCVRGSAQNVSRNSNRNSKEQEEYADAPLVLDSVSHNEATPNVATRNDVTPKPENKKGSRITFTELTPELREQAIKVRPDLSSDQIAFEFDCFLDYWRAKAGAGAVKRDWPATWRNWIRRSNQYGASGGGRPVTQTQAVDEFKRAAVSTRKPEEENEEEAAELLFG
jgi:hypothetical protein